MFARPLIHSMCVYPGKCWRPHSMCTPTRWAFVFLCCMRRKSGIIYIRCWCWCCSTWCCFRQVESEGKPVTNQKNSGRCWLFAALNCIRVPFIKQYNLDEFEFSQGYLFYWDKIERCHYFLNNIIETASRGEEVTGRLVSFLLHVSILNRLATALYTYIWNAFGFIFLLCRIQHRTVVSGTC